MTTITPTTQVVSLTASTHFPIKLTTSNYPVWKCQVHSALVGLGLDGYVDGSLAPPDKYMDAAKTQPNPCYSIWYRQDRTIISALLGSCADVIQPLISSATTAKQAWDKLSLTYASTSRGRIISLKTALSRTTKGGRSITEYVAEMYAISEALALAQNPISEEDLVINILNGLGSDYGELRSAIRVRNTPLPLAELQDILLEHEQKLHEAGTSAQQLVPTAHYTQTTGRVGDPSMSADRRHVQTTDRRGYHSRRGRGGNSSGQYRNPSNGIVCRFCNFSGHEVKQCRKLQRFLRDNQITPSLGSGSPAINNTVVNPMQNGQQWLFDSGASHHVTSDNSNLPNYTDYGGPDEVHLGDGSGHGGGAHARGEHP
ncbi:unnamed protein product [Cuscuta epithymum]|uniref:Retrotransposon Copia-like N-terminal domain-containing protein n=1 Tax=Cuscuta epithymum TaxID=186058 RepID=A0AAV0DCI4_9ASTE|nr:unnamed protein product [Cuscuta epithymum]CAH9098368.1 unnamed protein product [Cuscuta epithymum]